MTFWGWGFCGGFFIGLIGMAGVHTGHVFLIPLCYVLKATLSCAVLSGLTFILRRKITALGAIAFLVALIQVIMCIVMVIGLSSLLFR